MPTYDYRCDACSHQFEEFHSITAPPLKKCPVCGKDKLQRLISGGAAIVFKGNGFYQTDYRSESYKKGAKESKTHSETANSTPTPSASTTSSGESAVKSTSESKNATKQQA